MDKFDVEIAKAQMIKSFTEAIRQAGGDPEALLDRNMTFEEMVDKLAQNGIRFHYVGGSK